MASATAPDILAREVTVCASCLTASCLTGTFHRPAHKKLLTTQKTVRELLNLHLEPPRFWGIEGDEEIRRLYERRNREA